LNQNYTEAYNNRGAAYYDLKQYERAIEDYSKAIELNPNYVGAYINRGVTYYDLKQYERAIEDFDKAIELNPNLAEAYDYREHALSKLKEQKSVPGFKVVVAIAGLLAIAYLLRRRK
jgi:PGF-CTERM protein